MFSVVVCKESLIAVSHIEHSPALLEASVDMVDFVCNLKRVTL